MRMSSLETNPSSEGYTTSNSWHATICFLTRALDDLKSTSPGGRHLKAIPPPPIGIN